MTDARTSPLPPTYPHAADPPRWWCLGHYDPTPISHPATRAFPVYRCLDCGAELFHHERPKDEEDKIRQWALDATLDAALGLHP